MEGGVGLEVAIRPVRDVVKLENGLSIKDLKNLKNNILKAQMASLKEEKEKIKSSCLLPCFHITGGTRTFFSNPIGVLQLYYSF